MPHSGSDSTYPTVQFSGATSHLLREQGIDPDSATVLVLGATFKKDVVDIRNSKAIALVELLTTKFGRVHVYDPHVACMRHENAPFELIDDPFESGVKYDLVVLAVAHSEFASCSDRLSEVSSKNGIIVDVAGFLTPGSGDTLARIVWTL